MLGTHYWRHRTLCGVLEDMRKCQATQNYAPMAALIEEAQILADNMENGLSYGRDLNKLHAKRKKLEAKVKKLQAKLPKGEK